MKMILKYCSFIALLALVLTACKKDKPSGPQFGTVTDVDGNVYKTVKIGDQWWMAENLKTTHYRTTGELIKNFTTNTDWSNAVEGAYCDNPNIVDFAKTYGHLYNWYAVIDARGLAPEGWHVATDEDWTILTDFLGGIEKASDKLREAGTTHWESPNTGASNSSGFTAFPAGIRNILNGGFANPGKLASFWTILEKDTDKACERDLNVSDPKVYEVEYPKKGGLSVRCVKD